MKMKKLGFDRAFMDARPIKEDDKTLTVQAVIAREMVQKYPDGMSYKPADELEKAAWTADGRWVVPMNHPETGILVRRTDIAGRVTSPEFVKNLRDPKTDRPMGRGIKAMITWFKDKVDTKLLEQIKSGQLHDVSIGFTYDEDKTPGDFNGEHYDFIQRNMMVDHVCAPCAVGRCPAPYCGIGVDSLGTARRIAGDPWEETEDYVRSGHRSSSDFDPDSMRTIEITAGIKALIGCPRGKYKNGKCSVGTEVQSYLFDRKKYTLEEAKAWYRSHQDTDEIKPCPLTEMMNKDPTAFIKRLKSTFPDEELKKLFVPADNLPSPSAPTAEAATAATKPPGIPQPTVTAAKPQAPASPEKMAPAAILEEHREVMLRAKRVL